MEWTEITAEEFEAMPESTKAPTASEWDPIMAKLEAGAVVTLPFVDETDKKKKRLSVGRRSAIRGFEVEIRYDDASMAIRRGADREKIRVGRLPKVIAEKALGLVETVRDRIAHGDESDGPDVTEHITAEGDELSPEVAEEVEALAELGKPAARRRKKATESPA